MIFFTINKITRNSPISEYIQDMKESFSLDDEQIGLLIIKSIARAHKNNNHIHNNKEYGSFYKTDIITHIKSTIRQAWISMRMGHYDHIETAETIEPVSEKGIDMLINMLARERPDSFLKDLTTCTILASEEYSKNAAIPYRNTWKIYDILEEKLRSMTSLPECAECFSETRYER